jgi:MFS family permease
VGLNQNLGRLIGGPLGGVLLAVGDLGLVVAVDAISYALSAVMIWLVRSPAHRPSAGTAPDATGPVATGLVSVLRRPSLRGPLVIVFIASISQGMFLVLFVLFVVDQLNGTDADVGLLRGVQAIGAIAAGFALGLIGGRFSARALTASSTLVFGVISLLTWNLPPVTTNIVPYVVLFILVGAPGVVMTTGLITSLQSHSRDEERGSVFTMLGLLSALGQAIGMLAAGFLDAPLGIVPLLEIQGVIYLVAGSLAVWLMPRQAAVTAAAR